VNLVEQVRRGNVRAVARLMSLIEDGSPDATPALRALYPFTGSAYLVGITGPPGSGKSTLADRLTEAFRQQGLTVGIVAVDPTSPFTGGAILADRIRMQRHSLDPEVFIRSMATRGQLGGLAPATHAVVDVLDAAGKAIILIETVGVGQDEVEIVRLAHTTLGIMVPGMGDEVQAIKAGILEIGDLFVVNKADREGADRTVTELHMMLGLAATTGWRAPVLKTVASDGTGIPELVRAIEAHRTYLEQSGLKAQKRRERSRAAVLDLLRDRLTRAALQKARGNGSLDALLDRIARRDMDPYTAVDEIIRNVGL
jgi:LAO/AO transport system kinase